MMAADEDDQRMSLDQDEEVDGSSSSSENEDSGEEEDAPPVEWLATSRAKRSTAGNRMKSMLAAEEPDDELELLFAEDGEDGGFTDVEDDASDVQMDSSSDDEDAQENGEEDEGEKELERQARESRQAARKRKAQEAIPVKFRKKVKININNAGPSPSAPPPRPKKKSERTSWLPSPADMPTRASKRETTMLSKEQLHQQMIEREVKRLKQVEAMERKAKKMAALKKPPMTQAERLAEAAIVEKRNSKSLNRWEEAEKQREEERRAKLAALNNRTLDGPVVTFWSGVGEWVDGKLKHVGKIVTIEEKPVKKQKRVSGVGAEEAAESQSKDKDGQEKDAKDATAPGPDSTKPVEGDKPVQPTGNADKKDSSEENSDNKVISDQNPPQKIEEKTAEPTTAPDIPPKDTQQKEPPPAPESKAPEKSPPEPKAPEMKPPDMRPPESGLYTTSMFAPPQQVQVMKPPELQPPSNSFLAPPPGVTRNGLSMPMLGYSPASNNKTSNVLAPPNTAQTTQKQSPLSIPQTNNQPLSTPSPAPSRPAQTPNTAAKAHPPSKPLSNLKPTQTNASKKQNNIPASPPRPPTPPANGKATRNCIILQNFDENSINQKAVQTRILFGKEMNKLGKHAPAPKCVITNHPARYKDPKTGLPYSNGYAFKEIQKLQRGDYKWSRLVGAWVGTGSCAARGVPARFLDPKAPGPVKKPEVKAEPDTASGAKPAEAVKPVESAQSKSVAPGPSSTGVNSTQNAQTTTPVVTGPPLAAPAPVVTPTPVTAGGPPKAAPVSSAPVNLGPLTAPPPTTPAIATTPTATTTTPAPPGNVAAPVKQ